MQQVPIKTPIEKKAEDNSLKEVWNEFRKIFLDGVERIEKKNGLEVTSQDGR